MRRHLRPEQSPELPGPNTLMYVPGRGSYLTTKPEGGFTSHLTSASTVRAQTAANIYDPAVHDTVVISGGYPGIANKWPSHHRPPKGGYEADLMGAIFKENLRQKGWTEADFAAFLRLQPDSNSTFDDIIKAAERGYLDPNAFNSNPDRTIEQVVGDGQRHRTRAILSRYLDIDPQRIYDVPTGETHYRPPTEFDKGQPAWKGAVIEVGAIAVTTFVLHHVEPGNLDSLRQAEQSFNRIANS
jgi:hypothetical protein